MRRLVANSLLLLFLGMFIAPAFTAATTSSPLPACCRRGGAHHCAMMAMLISEEGTSFRSVNPCPMQHQGQLGPTVAIAPPASQSAHIDLRPETLVSRAVSRAEFTLALANHQRGPPSSHS